MPFPDDGDTGRELVADGTGDGAEDDADGRGEDDLTADGCAVTVTVTDALGMIVTGIVDGASESSGAGAGPVVTAEEILPDSVGSALLDDL